jgi:hypothetical protein
MRPVHQPGKLVKVRKSRKIRGTAEVIDLIVQHGVRRRQRVEVGFGLSLNARGTSEERLAPSTPSL